MSDTSNTEETTKRRIVVRLPGFLLKGEVGLGEMVSKAAQMVGAEPCDDCKRRGDAMNRRLIFRGRGE